MGPTIPDGGGVQYGKFILPRCAPISTDREITLDSGNKVQIRTYRDPADQGKRLTYSVLLELKGGGVYDYNVQQNLLLIPKQNEELTDEKKENAKKTLLSNLLEAREKAAKNSRKEEVEALNQVFARMQKHAPGIEYSNK